jgi:hypothetical protein
MALFTKQELRARAARDYASYRAGTVLLEAAKSFSASKKYDVFLSHSYLDAQEVLGLRLLLEDQGLIVYVDWIDDPTLDRSKVTRDTAAKLRTRMRSCKTLFYASSPNATTSKWMPWELGYFDGHNGKVAVVPIVDGYETSFSGQEYLSLYPWIDKAGANLFVNGVPGATSFQSIRQWLPAA